MSNLTIGLTCQISKEADALFGGTSGFNKVRASDQKRKQLAKRLKKIFDECSCNGCSRKGWELIIETRKKLKLLKQVLKNKPNEIICASNITGVKNPVDPWCVDGKAGR